MEEEEEEEEASAIPDRFPVPHVGEKWICDVTGRVAAHSRSNSVRYSVTLSEDILWERLWVVLKKDKRNKIHQLKAKLSYYKYGKMSTQYISYSF
jgi:hypothetical protein